MGAPIPLPTARTPLHALAPAHRHDALQARRLWTQGLDTLAIAKSMGRGEAEACRLLALTPHDGAR